SPPSSASSAAFPSRRPGGTPGTIGSSSVARGLYLRRREWLRDRSTPGLRWPLRSPRSARERPAISFAGHFRLQPADRSGVEPRAARAVSRDLALRERLGRSAANDEIEHRRHLRIVEPALRGHRPAIGLPFDGDRPRHTADYDQRKIAASGGAR